MTQDNNSLPPSAGATTGGSTTGYTSGSSASGGSTGGFGGSSDFSDTSRPTGSTTSSSFQPTGSSYTPETRDYRSETGNHQPSGGPVTYRESSSSRPSTAVVLGAAIAGAITGGAIPFILAGRKPARKSDIVVDERRGFEPDAQQTGATFFGDRDGSYRR